MAYSSTSYHTFITMGNGVGLDTRILTSGKKPVSVLGMVAVALTAVRRLFVT
jgi:hypothetical protein